MSIMFVKYTAIYTHGYHLHGAFFLDHWLDDSRRFCQLVRRNLARELGKGVTILHVVLEGIFGAHEGADHKVVVVRKRFVQTAAGAAGRIQSRSDEAMDTKKETVSIRILIDFD